MALDLSGRGGLAYLMKLLQGGMWAPQQQQGEGGTMWGGPGGGGWLGQQGGGGGAPSPVGAGGGAPAAPVAPTAGAGGGEDAQTEMLRGLMEIYGQQVAKQPTAEEAYAAKRQAQDPVGWANKMRSVPGFEWSNPAGAFYDRPRLSPEAVLASQGNTATNQWAQQGGVEGISPEELKRLNVQTKLSRRTYV